MVRVTVSTKGPLHELWEVQRVLAMTPVRHGTVRPGLSILLPLVSQCVAMETNYQLS